MILTTILIVWFLWGCVVFYVRMWQEYDGFWHSLAWALVLPPVYVFAGIAWIACGLIDWSKSHLLV